MSSLIDEKKFIWGHYQVLDVRYMCADNNAIKRFLISHSSDTGKSFTALWILLNFIKVFEKKTLILIKCEESILEFKQWKSSWYSYTFNFLKPLPEITNYHQQFINKYT